MKRSSLILTSIFLISMLSQILVIHAQSVIPPIQIKGFKKVGTLPQSQNVVFTVYVPLKNQGLLYYYAQAVSNPSSPLYHHFLSKEEVEKLFYPTSQFNQVLSYLKSKGFNVLLTAADSVIVAEGTVGQIESTLGVNYAVYSNGSLTYYTVYGVPKFNVYIESENLTPLFFEHPSTLLTQGAIKKFYQSVNQTFAIEAYWPTALQKVYNLTWLFSRGYEGQNYTIGILDPWGDPYIRQQLAYFDKVTGLPNPPNFTVIPIGPYHPDLSVYCGSVLEISLDVEVAHTMAPKANIILYAANFKDVPLPAIIAYIDSQDNVDVLSQSFGVQESLFSLLTGQSFYSLVVLTDEYYAMGVAEGITFIASSGDAGGSGYSNGPIGTVFYPSVSPYVLAAGGTVTYIQFPNGSYLQTAWSSLGFVPNFVNDGGSTGGVSIVEPKPWYQFSLSTPASYPSGRETPDVSANAPRVYVIIPGNITAILGGTSEASPLIAGALVSVMSYVGHRLGLINPTLYQIAENSPLYSKVFYPITFGYTIPWTASYGYNLVTGWGALNFGELATVLSTLHSKPQLSIVVNVYNQAGETPEEFFPGQQMLIIANITYNNISVTSGKFYATIESVEGNITTVALSYDPTAKEWVATTTLPSNANGILLVYVYGSYNGTEGLGYFETFSGYYLTFLSPINLIEAEIFSLGGPFDSNITPLIIAFASDIYGEPAPPNTTFSLTLYSYNITTNTYTDIGSVTLKYNSSMLLDNLNIGLWEGSLPTLPAGVILAKANNAYGYDAFMNGISLRDMFVLPDAIALFSPGSVAEGQYIVIEGSIEPPLALNETSPITYEYMEYGSNVTAYLLNSSGKVISSVNVSLIRSFTGVQPIFAGTYLGYLKVPTGIKPGLYTILLEAVYYSSTLNEYVTGQFYGQIYVTPSASVPQIHTVKYAYEGQTIQFYANITYPNGTEVKFGMYSATVYPRILSSEYSYITQITYIYSLQIPLWYNPSMNLWVGNVTLPSSLSLGNLTYFATTYYGVPFDIYVSGVSADGVPTTTNISSQYQFYVLPYTEVQDQTIDYGLTYNAFLDNDTIVGNVTLVNDILDNTKIEGHVTIVNSNITSITVKDGSVEIIDSQVSSINAINSSITLVNTFANYVNLTSSSTISLIDSKIANISPPLPSVSILLPKPNSNITGILTVSYFVAGQDVSEVKIFLNGELLTTSSSTSGNYTVNTSLYPDGTYNITVEAVQTDGLSSSVSEFVNFENQLSSLNTNLHSDVSTINSQISSTASTLNSKISTVQTYATVGIALAIVAIIGIIGLGILLMRRR